MKQIGLIFVLVIVMVTSTVLAEPVQWTYESGGNGHWYEIIGGRYTGYDQLTWSEADERAKAMTSHGYSGHLVTVTSPEELEFIYSMPESACDDPEWTPCSHLHVGGWYFVTAVYPSYIFPNVVEASSEQWITGEVGSCDVYPFATSESYVGELMHFVWGPYNPDGMGAYPPHGVYGIQSPVTLNGFIVEYDDLAPSNYPDEVVSTVEMTWGRVKAFYR